jgi:hypothetical protein
MMGRICRILPVLMAVVLTGCDLCSDDIKGGLSSPDQALKATWFVRNCGATTDFSTIVSVNKPTGDYRADANIIFVAKGSREMRVRWEGSRHLLVECEGCEKGDIVRQSSSMEDLRVEYRNH